MPTNEQKVLHYLYEENKQLKTNFEQLKKDTFIPKKMKEECEELRAQLESLKKEYIKENLKLKEACRREFVKIHSLIRRSKNAANNQDVQAPIPERHNRKIS